MILFLYAIIILRPMSYTFRCKDIGYNECSFEYEAEERKDLMPRVRIHCRYAHNVFEMKPEQEKQIEESIKEKK